MTTQRTSSGARPRVRICGPISSSGAMSKTAARWTSGMKGGKYRGLLASAGMPVSTAMRPSGCSINQTWTGNQSVMALSNQVFRRRRIPVPSPSRQRSVMRTRPVSMAWIFMGVLLLGWCEADLADERFHFVGEERVDVPDDRLDEVKEFEHDVPVQPRPGDCGQMERVVRKIVAVHRGQRVERALDLRGQAPILLRQFDLAALDRLREDVRGHDEAAPRRRVRRVGGLFVGGDRAPVEELEVDRMIESPAPPRMGDRGQPLRAAS